MSLRVILILVVVLISRVNIADAQNSNIEPRRTILPVPVPSDAEVKRNGLKAVVAFRAKRTETFFSHSVRQHVWHKAGLSKELGVGIRPVFFELKQTLQQIVATSAKSIDGSDSASGEELVHIAFDDIKKAGANFGAGVREIVGSAKYKELKKAVMEAEYSSRGLALMLRSGLKSELKLSRKQSSMIDEIDQEIQDAILASNEKIRKAGNDRIFKTLDSEQRKKLSGIFSNDLPWEKD